MEVIINSINKKLTSLLDVNGKIRFIIPLNGFDDLVNRLADVIDKNYRPDLLNHEKDGKKLAEKIIHSG